MFPAERFFEKLDPPSLSLLSHTEVRASPSSGLLWSGFIGRKITRKGEKGCRSLSTFTSYGGRPEKWNEGGRNSRLFNPKLWTAARGWNEFLFFNCYKKGQEQCEFEVWLLDKIFWRATPTFILNDIKWCSSINLKKQNR